MVQGFYFIMLQYDHIQAFTARFVSSMQLYSKRRKTSHGALQRIFLRFDPLNRHRYKADTIGYNTACATLERITAPGHPPAHTRYQRHAGTLHRSAQPHTMQARRGQLLPCVDRWQVLTRCQQYRPGAPADVSASPPVKGQPGGGLDASHARRLAVWHRVIGQSGHSGTLHPAEQSSRSAAGSAEPLAAFAVSLFGLSPDSQ